jgi:hypothetical protein
MFLLGTFLTLLAVVIDRAVGTCGVYQTQVGYSMCNWQSVRGKSSFLAIAVEFCTDSDSQRHSRYDLHRWRVPMVCAVWKDLK